MAIFKWTELVDKTTIKFSSLASGRDVFKFDLLDIHASAVTVSWQGSTSVSFSYQGKTITLLTDFKTLTTDSIQFADRSVLVIGDERATVANDDNGNAMSYGNSYTGNQFFGLGGGDTIYGGGGDDYLSGGDGDDYLFGDKGKDTLDGGGGVNWMFGDDGDDVYIISTRDFYIGEHSGVDTAYVRTNFAKIPTTIEHVI